jgi:hypothetical protein
MPVFRRPARRKDFGPCDCRGNSNVGSIRTADVFNLGVRAPVAQDAISQTEKKRRLANVA